MQLYVAYVYTILVQTYQGKHLYVQFLVAAGWLKVWMNEIDYAKDVRLIHDQ